MTGSDAVCPSRLGVGTPPSRRQVFTSAPDLGQSTEVCPAAFWVRTMGGSFESGAR